MIQNNYADNRADKEQGWYLLADSAVTNTGKPFYQPEGLGKVSVSLCPAVRMARLGKSISPKFASRYYSELAPALHFRLPQYWQQLQEANLSTDAAVNFDRSLFVGDALELTRFEELILLLNGKEKSKWEITKLRKSIDQILSEISMLNTIKMGDMILPGLCEEIDIKEGDLIEVILNGELSFKVKVK